MKKLLLVVLLGMLSAGARADIGVDWSSDSWFSPFGVFPDPDTTNPTDDPSLYIPQNAYHVLIWSMSFPPIGAYATAGTGLGAGEIKIWDSKETARSGDTREGGGQFNYSTVAIVFTDAQAGGTATAGYVYSRIFSNSTVSAGDWYYQSQAFEVPPLLQYTVEAPNTFIHITSNWETYGDRTMGSGLSMYQVIPEPGTLLLTLPAAALIFIRRRNMTA